MKRQLLLVLAFMISTACYHSAALGRKLDTEPAETILSQQTVEIVTLESEGQEIVATLMLPVGGPAPVVLLLHGFLGSRDGLVIPSTKQGVFVRTAQILANSGFASLRIDFRGSGESIAGFTFEETTFEGQISDALVAIEYLENLEKVDGEDIHVIGWSQGGLVASAVAGRSNKLDAVALWQAVGDTTATYTSLFGDETLALGKAALPDQTIVVTLPWGAEVSLNGGFFDGMETLDPIEEIKGFSGPLFVTQGLADTIVSPETAEQFIRAHEGSEKLWSADMDHVFNVFDGTQNLDSMIEETIKFFKINAD